jgi:hypothetical protein
MYTAQYFIDKFEAIPEEEWCTGAISYEGKHCAYGHCGYMHTHTDESSALRGLFQKLERFTFVTEVNDCKEAPYLQETPKQRILAALRDIVEKGNE